MRSWGRNAEGGTEDPRLMAELGVAWTRGLQRGEGDDPRFLQARLSPAAQEYHALGGTGPSVPVCCNTTPAPAAVPLGGDRPKRASLL